MTEADRTKLSRFLSLVLRHRPQEIGITLDEQGWTDVDPLLEALKRHRHPVDFALLEEVVETNDKRRFSFSEDCSRIRANQGHSVAVDLGLAPRRPPDLLYHGTVERFLTDIRAQGLVKGQRHHVHLSATEAVAVAVGRRRGQSLILTILAGAMQDVGFAFYQSENGVWLTDAVPPDYLQFPP